MDKVNSTKETNNDNHETESKGGVAIEGKSATGKPIEKPEQDSSPMSIIGSTEFGEVTSAIQQATGNIADPFGNKDYGNAEEIFGNGGIDADVAAGIGAVFKVFESISALIRGKGNTMDKVGALAGSVASGTDLLHAGMSLAGNSGGEFDAVLQIDGAIGGLASAGFGTVSEIMEGYKKYKEGNNLEASIAVAGAMQKGTGAVDRAIKIAYGISEYAKNGADALGKSTELSGGAASASSYLGMAGAGLGLGLGVAEVLTSIDELEKGRKEGGDLKRLQQDENLDSDALNILTTGQGQKETKNIEQGVRGFANTVTGGISLFAAISGAGASAAVVVGLTSGVLIGGYKLLKYCTGSMKQGSVDKIVEDFFHTYNDTDYSPYLKRGLEGFVDYKKARTMDINLELQAAEEEKKEQKEKGFIEQMTAKDPSIQLNEKFDKYIKMDEIEYVYELAGVYKVYNDSTHAKIIQAADMAEKAIKMLNSLTGADRNTLLKALGLSEGDLDKIGEGDDTSFEESAKNIKILASELMKILSQAEIKSM